MNNPGVKYNLLLFILLIPFSVLGQGRSRHLNDTIKKPSINASIIDTLYVNNQIKYDQFYDSLVVKASKNRITKTALSLLLVNNPDYGNYIGIENMNYEDYYSLYSGKKIRNIDIVKLDVFGPSLTDTAGIAKGWLDRFGNNTHISTRDYIIKNNLLFDLGDTIDPMLIIDNERIIRELGFIKDASIQIVEIPDNEDYVDVLVVTKDVYSAGLHMDLIDSKSGTFELYENNLAGIGHKLYGKLYVNTVENPKTGYEFNYKIENIGGSFLRSNIKYLKVFETERYGVELNRNFFSYNTKWAGGLSIFQTSTQKDIKKTDTTLNDVRLNYSSQDVWFGWSFLVKTNNWQYQNRSRLVLATRYINHTFYKGPFVSERYNFQYHDNQIALFSIAYSRQKYYKSNLIYGFGKTEDIPIGDLFQINTGIEKDEFYKRFYIGFKLSKGAYYPQVGYLNYHGEFGGLYYQDRLEQGAMKINVQAISNLHSFNRLRLREFLSINYIRGINRFNDENLYFNPNDIWGMSTEYLYGVKKISFNSELVIYSKIHVYNFKFLFFGFGDLGFIGPENKSVFENQAYAGIGIGARIRNENLVFKTFQLKFAFYPVTPPDVNQFYFSISGENYKKPVNFEPTSPSIVEYN